MIAADIRPVNRLPALYLNALDRFVTTTFKRLFPRDCIAVLLGFGTALAVLMGQTHFSNVRVELAAPRGIAHACTLPWALASPA